MDSISLTMQNRLFWLGRYSERVYSTLQYLLKQLDRRIDGTDMDYQDFCQRMGIPCPYQNSHEFFQRYLFSPDAPCSLRSSADNMLGNGMVLREILSTSTLAYLQMAQSAMELAARSEGPTVELQWVLDDIMAFRGSFADSVERESYQSVTQAGIRTERISLMLRLDWRQDSLDAELRKLLNHLYKADLTTDTACLDALSRQVLQQERLPKKELLQVVEGLFLV